MSASKPIQNTGIQLDKTERLNLGDSFIQSQQSQTQNKEPSNLDIYANRLVVLNIEDGREVFYRGAYVRQIKLKGDCLTIGRRDVIQGFYPDVDLAMYRREDPQIEPAHLKIYRNIQGYYFVKDLSKKKTSFLNSFDQSLNGRHVQLKVGDRILISKSIVMVFAVH